MARPELISTKHGTARAIMIPETASEDPLTYDEEIILELTKELKEFKREMKTVEDFLKPNFSNDMPWSDDIIIAIQNREQDKDARIMELEKFIKDMQPKLKEASEYLKKGMEMEKIK